jgi:hypothetical protein
MARFDFFRKGDDVWAWSKRLVSQLNKYDFSLLKLNNFGNSGKVVTASVDGYEFKTVGELSLGTLVNAVDDTAAAAAGVGVGRMYRNGSVLMVRVV